MNESRRILIGITILLFCFVLFATTYASGMHVKSITMTTDNQDFLKNSAIQAFIGIAGISLNRQAEIAKSLSLFNITSEHFPEKYSWDDDDWKTVNWIPQGITGNDYYEPNSKILITSWYANDNVYKGARISCIDLESLQYRNILLVQNKNNVKTTVDSYTQGDSFAPVRVHAGGISWLGNYLYVADTNNGIRVFDLTKIYELKPNSNKNLCGVIDGKAFGFDYKYALPQVASYKIEYSDQSINTPFSCISLERKSDSEMCFWTGQYIKKDEKDKKNSPFITGFNFIKGSNSDIPELKTENTEIIYPKDNEKTKEYNNAVYYMQGVYRQGIKTWMTITGQSKYKNSTARLITWKNDDAEGTRWRWPYGSEDLYYSPKTGKLWSLTEHNYNGSVVINKTIILGKEKSRLFFNVKIDTYPPSI